MIDLRQRLSELDQLEAPDMRADIERRAADLVTMPRDSVIEPIPVPSPWRGPLIALGTAAAILAIVAGVVILLFRDDPGEVTDQTEIPTPTTVAPSETTEPPAPTTTPQGVSELHHRGDAQDVGWTVVQFPNPLGVFTQLANGLWVGLDPGWQCHTADGYHESCPPQPWSDTVADPIETLWTSANGTDWAAHEVPELVGMMVHVDYYGPSLDARGGLLWIEVSPVGGTAPTQTWITDDGETWHQVEWITSELALPNVWSWLGALSRLDDVVFITMQNSSGTPQHLVSTDAGRRFTEINPFPAGEYATAHWSAGEELRALVENGTNRLALWRSVDGHQWEPLGDATGLWPKDIAYLSASDEAIIAGSHGVRCDRCSDQEGAWPPNDVPVASLDGGLTWHKLDVFAAMPPKTDPPFFDRGIAIGSINDWFIVRRHKLVWVSRNGQDWYSIEGGAALEGRYGTSNHAKLHVDDGILMPPTE